MTWAFQDEHWREPTYEAVTLSHNLKQSARSLIAKIRSLRAKWAQEPEDALVVREKVMLWSLRAKILTILSFSSGQHQVLNIQRNESAGVEQVWQTETHWDIDFPLWVYVSDFKGYLDPILVSIEKNKGGDTENNQDIAELLRTIESDRDALGGVLACIAE